MNEPRTIEEQYTSAGNAGDLTRACRKALEKLFGKDWQASHREVLAEFERLQAMKFIIDNDQPTPKP